MNILGKYYGKKLVRKNELFSGAGDRGRTGTSITAHGILSPGRLPVPPHRQNVRIHMHENYYIT